MNLKIFLQNCEREIERCHYFFFGFCRFQVGLHSSGLVENLEALAEELKKEGVTLLNRIQTSVFEKFVHVTDLEGNKVDLGICRMIVAVHEHTCSISSKKSTRIPARIFCVRSSRRHKIAAK